jgi:molybdenum cofactor cytidylyltransferase
MIACLLLAAGSSSRMGKPKMLLPFNGKTLLQHAIDEVNKLSDNKLLVVTGRHHDLTEKILLEQKISFVENKNWEEGMGSSIQTGMQYILEKYSEPENVIILVCDQPYLSSSLLLQLIAAQEQTGRGISVSAYDNTFGTPVLFTKKYFNQLVLFNGQAGAKKIVYQFIEDTVAVDFPKGNIDIDTLEDYEQLLK